MISGRGCNSCGWFCAGPGVGLNDPSGSFATQDVQGFWCTSFMALLLERHLHHKRSSFIRCNRRVGIPGAQKYSQRSHRLRARPELCSPCSLGSRGGWRLSPGRSPAPGGSAPWLRAGAAAAAAGSQALRCCWQAFRLAAQELLNSEVAERMRKRWRQT